jgi:hypothetical protein
MKIANRAPIWWKMIPFPNQPDQYLIQVLGMMVIGASSTQGLELFKFNSVHSQEGSPNHIDQHPHYTLDHFGIFPKLKSEI